MAKNYDEIDNFVLAYMKCGDETLAFKETFSNKRGYVARMARKDAKSMMASEQVKTRLAVLTREATRNSRLEATTILGRMAQIAFADLTQVVKVRRVNCRHCWGKGFGYQTTQAEFDMLCVDAFSEAQTNKVQYVEPKQSKGGLGFSSIRPPHPDCPECSGEGYAESFVEDFDKIPEDVKPLISGVEQTKYGLKVTFHDQVAALKMLAQCFNLLDPDTVKVIIQQMRPDEPRARVEMDVTDVVAADEIYREMLNG